MNRVIILLLSMMIFFVGCTYKKNVKPERLCAFMTADDIVMRIPQTTSDVESLVTHTKLRVQTLIQELQAKSKEKILYDNSVLIFEKIHNALFVAIQFLTVLANLSTLNDLRLSAHIGLQELQSFQATVLSDPLCFNIVSRYFDKLDHQGKNHHVLFYVNYLIDRAHQDGLDLDETMMQKVMALKSEIRQIEGRYFANVVYDQRYVICSESELCGLSKDFIKSLPSNDRGLKVIVNKSDIVFPILEQCSVELTRKKVFEIFASTAWPINDSLLEELLVKRHQLAELLKYPSYAAMQFNSFMKQDPFHIQTFLDSLLKHLKPLSDKRFHEMIKDLPKSVELLSNGKMKAWDEQFVKSTYRKKHFNYDDVAISEYFELSHVLPIIVEQLEKIFNISCQKTDIVYGWSPDLICYQVRNLGTQRVVGYLLFDLKAREGKIVENPYNCMILPSLIDDCSMSCVGADVVVAGYKSDQQGHYLLTFGNIMTLFHEIGHGLHALLGNTRYTQIAGTNVAQDFVEVPSLVLEYFCCQPSIIKALSKHIDTGQSLTDTQIKLLLDAQKFFAVDRMLKDIFLAQLSLNLCMKERKCTDFEPLVHSLYDSVFVHTAYNDFMKYEANFIHLVQPYAAAYYTYPLSKVIGADIWSHILFHKQNGGIWRRYVETIIAPGGGANPATMIKTFLTRPYQKKAFLDYVE